ncbi:MAG: hypothetical protein P4M08_13850 [Oligoflexia bacterium]|nr:hypothetical protein [Oligoflexia bacterium]
MKKLICTMVALVVCSSSAFAYVNCTANKYDNTGVSLQLNLNKDADGSYSYDDTNVSITVIDQQENGVNQIMAGIYSKTTKAGSQINALDTVNTTLSLGDAQGTQYTLTCSKD